MREDLNYFKHNNNNNRVSLLTLIKIGPRRRGGCDCITTLTFVKHKGSKISIMFKDSPLYNFHNLSELCFV